MSLHGAVITGERKTYYSEEEELSRNHRVKLNGDQEVNACSSDKLKDDLKIL
jgi:hypothetical protein